MISKVNETLLFSILKGEKKSVRLEAGSPMDIDSVLTSKDLYQKNIDTNGWQHDFWITYVRNSDEKEFMFSGGWWDGTANFSVREDE